MDFDTLIFAVIAVVLIARLWSVLGRRDDSDPQRPNPFVTPAPGTGPKDDPKAILSDVKDIAGNSDPFRLLRPPQSAPESLAGNLEQIKTLDPSFDEKTFLQGARAAFTMIVEDFAKGDLNRITRLLGPKVLPSFQNAIEARRKAGQTMENRVTRIREAETTAVHIEDTRVSLTIRFVSEQSNVLRDNQGKVIGGAPDAIEEVTDMWTFSRDTKSADPNWILAETHS